MPSIFRLSRLAFFCLLLLPRFAVSAEVMPPLNAPPAGQQWFGVFLGEERVGFAHTTTRTVPNGYEVVSDSSTKMTVMGFSRGKRSPEKATGSMLISRCSRSSSSRRSRAKRCACRGR